MEHGSLRPIQVVAITGGKGGVGKTNVSVNLGVAMCRMGRRVTLLDADLGLANVDVLLGLKPRHTLKDVLDGSVALTDVIVEGPLGLKIVPAASGMQEMVRLGPQQHAGLISAFSDIAHQMDVLLIDTAAGISDEVISFLCAAQEILVVVCDEPTSITDAYALIKVLNQRYGIDRVRVVANMVRTEEEGARVFEKLQGVSERFLDVQLLHAGSVPFDDHLRRAVRKQRAVVDLYPMSKAARSLLRLAEEVDSWPIPAVASGHLEFFVERLVAEHRVG
ncbi:MAG: MinD/ParA family protein [Pseudomonadales bacterium]|nr:MinD/ParA family protein [Pseudomonadales bacterium]MCP5184765.1 MinD/ParA family protein [Pseudomonadales bacterium]